MAFHEQALVSVNGSPRTTYLIRSGRSLFGDKPYCPGPVAIGTRTSPFGGPPAPNPHSGRIAMCRNDPRQRGLLGADRRADARSDT